MPNITKGSRLKRRDARYPPAQCSNRRFLVSGSTYKGSRSPELASSPIAMTGPRVHTEPGFADRDQSTEAEATQHEIPR
jgi:hypothetical protein